MVQATGPAGWEQAEGCRPRARVACSSEMRVLWLTAILAAGTACATATGGGGSGSGGPGGALTREQLVATGAPNAYDAVARLRPRWLMARSPATLQGEGNPVLVYVDGQRMGQLQELRNLPIEGVSEIGSWMRAMPPHATVPGTPAVSSRLPPCETNEEVTMISRRAVTGVVVALAVGACSSASTPGSGTAPRRTGNVITAEEITASSAPTALELVRHLRPAWLTERGLRGTGGAAAPGATTSQATEGPAGVVVYRDGVRLGMFASLETIPVETIREVRWLNGRDATQRYGTGHGAGAIEVLTRR